MISFHKWEIKLEIKKYINKKTEECYNDSSEGRN